MKANLVLALFFVCCFGLVFQTSSVVAEEVATGDKAPSVAEVDPPACDPETAAFSDPVFASTCFVQVECSNGSVISCSGNSTCSTGGTNHRCVICDGVNKGCCPKTCCEVCEESYDSCLFNCGGPPVNCERVCGRGYNVCVNQCTGGCP